MLKEIYTQLYKQKDSIHELDTIERLIVPVIEMAGWKIHSPEPLELQRGNSASRGTKRRFDIALYKSKEENPRVVFECKKMANAIRIEGKGCSQNIKDSTDYIRQIRNYCINSAFPFEQNFTTPILTNGIKWLVFTNSFTLPERKDENIDSSNRNDFILLEKDITQEDFCQIIKFLNMKRFCTINAS